MSNKPIIPNQIPLAYKKYKEKSHLTDIEIANKINSLIKDEDNKLTISTNDFGIDKPSSTYYSYFSLKKI